MLFRSRALPFSSRVFDGGVNLFTSFGYFEKDEADLAALREAARVLKAGAIFVLDFFNLEPTLASLVPRSQRTWEGRRMVETRRYDSRRRRLEKTIRIENVRAPKESRFILESVRAYTPGELHSLFFQAGLDVPWTFGDLRGADFDARSSPRCVLVGRKR